MPRLHILTIGYEDVSLTDFIATLKSHRVRQVLDVRELAMSRRRGFSKTALSLALAGAGIPYAHEPALGTPRWLRHRLREDGDFALLCYERKPSECHRSLVAAALGRMAGAAVEHLMVPAIQ